MAIVNFWYSNANADGSYAPATGKLRIMPTKAHVVDGREVLPVPFEVKLDSEGKASVSLEPTDGTAWAWRVEEDLDGYPQHVTYVTVGTDATSYYFSNLATVDPTKLP